MNANLDLDCSSGDGARMSVSKLQDGDLCFSVTDNDVTASFYLSPDDCAPLLNFISAFGGE